MRVAFLSYPMLFQRLGGLQVQVRETLASLVEVGIAAQLFDSNKEKLADFDIIHVFGAINGNYRVVEAAKNADRAVVISPILHPFSKQQGRTVRFCDALIGRLTNWEFHTSYRQIRTALEKADAVIALGEAESCIITEGYLIDSGKVRIIPNGVARRFFDADGSAFRRHSGIMSRFALQVASVSPYKNQLTGIRALAGNGIQYVMIGGCAREHRRYLDQCLSAENGKVYYAGAFSPDDPLLASAYAAADVFVLPSRSEVMPLVVLEALAAGTPVVMTRHSSLKFEEARPRVIEVDPQDVNAIASAVREVLDARPAKASCQSLVADYSWQMVAGKIKGIYEYLLD